MSIDYSANHGIGYEVCEGDSLLEDEDFDNLEEYVYNQCSERFETFSTNDGYDTDTDGVFLTIKDPFKEGLDLTVAKNTLDAEIERLELGTCGEFGSVGGMRVL